jgi:hypothetical protein
MIRITYKGLSEQDKEAKLVSAMAGSQPQDKRGKHFYEIMEKDREAVKEEKRARRAEWLAKRKAEVIAEIEAADSVMEVRGARLPKGVAVDLEDDHPLCLQPIDKRTGKKLGQSKMQSLEAAGVISVAVVDEITGGEGPVKQPSTTTLDGLLALSKRELIEMAEANSATFEKTMNKEEIASAILAVKGV